MGADEEAALIAFAALHHPPEKPQYPNVLSIFDGCLPLPPSAIIHVGFAGRVVGRN
jgi:hypothetical protein